MWDRRQKLIVKQWISNDTQRIAIADEKITWSSKEKRKEKDF